MVCLLLSYVVRCLLCRENVECVKYACDTWVWAPCVDSLGDLVLVVAISASMFERLVGGESWLSAAVSSKRIFHM